MGLIATPRNGEMAESIQNILLKREQSLTISQISSQLMFHVKHMDI